MNSKVRRHSGRRTPRVIFNGMGKEEIIENCLEPRESWDDWNDYRDGMRCSNDRKQIRNVNCFGSNYFKVKRWNDKLKKLIEIRRARKKTPQN